MRIYLFVVISISIALLSCSDNTDRQAVHSVSEHKPAESVKQISKDTFSFEHPFAADPLLLKKETLSSVKALLGDSTDIEIEGPNKIPDFDEELIGFSKDNSRITAFNNSSRIGWLVYSAEIADSLPIFEHHVIIGMTKQDFIKEFNLPKESIVANVFEVYSGEATSYVYLIFESGVLRKIVYWPYTG